MNFRRAESDDMAEIMRITNAAKAQLRQMGLNQWQKGYPSAEVWADDIAHKRAWLAVEGDKALGVFVFQTEPERAYSHIDGAWLTDGQYASLHRLCVAEDSRGKGIAGAMLRYGADMARAKGIHAMRIDTHAGNLPMRRALAKSGFERCGEITLCEGCEMGDSRTAFECII